MLKIRSPKRKTSTAVRIEGNADPLSHIINITMNIEMISTTIHINVIDNSLNSYDVSDASNREVISSDINSTNESDFINRLSFIY